eukprot:TRINITY_DN8534_c0_g1_i1.p2 TRINITY_DN8534_c0_g1~~TRINITY_DN8534_c0_g1_i1.p2  ORF type:complete len:131 (+),score=5.30 TRINITY_DN8534_c0_g1_i1:182-574(+)
MPLRAGGAFAAGALGGIAQRCAGRLPAICSGVGPRPPAGDPLLHSLKLCAPASQGGAYCTKWRPAAKFDDRKSQGRHNKDFPLPCWRLEECLTLPPQERVQYTTGIGCITFFLSLSLFLMTLSKFLQGQG